MWETACVWNVWKDGEGWNDLVIGHIARRVAAVWIRGTNAQSVGVIGRNFTKPDKFY